MSQFLIEAVKGIKAEMAALPTLPDRLARLPKVLGILLSEVVGLFALIPYAVSTMALYRSLPGPSADARHAKLGVTVERDVQYADGERCVLDVYAPVADAAGGDEEEPASSRSALPVVMFVHGGVWASGEKWHYAPMATRLAQEGYLVVVPSYELYPRALCPQMVREVSDALSWTLDHVRSRGGDPAAVALVGHSAGAHLTAMVLLARASAAAAAAAAAVRGTSALGSVATRDDTAPAPATTDAAHAPAAAGPSCELSPDPASASEPAEQPAASGAEWLGDAPGRAGVTETAAYLHGAGTSVPDAVHSVAAAVGVGGGAPGASPSGVEGGADGMAVTALASALGVSDGRMPALCVNMAGVYDVAKHYEFETARGVQELSMMKRAMGGPAGFAAMSPSVLLRGEDGAREHHAAGATNDASALPRHWHAFELTGEAIPARSGLLDGRVGPAPAPAISAAGQPSASSLPAGMQTPSSARSGDGDGGGGAASAAVDAPNHDLHRVRGVAAHLPPTFVMSSCADHMVPWHEGAEYVSAMARARAPARHLIYNHVLHSDYVMSWHPMSGAAAAAHARRRGGGSSQQRGAPAPVPGRGVPPLKDFARDFLSLTRARLAVRSHASSRSVQVPAKAPMAGVASLSRL